MNGRAALRSYSQNDTRAKTENESPEKLILLLLEKGCLLIQQAIHSLETEDLERFHETTTHCMQIVVALRGLLDFENGGKVAGQLAETYDVINASLFKAKRERSISSLSKLGLALAEIKEGWETIVHGRGA